MQCTTKQEVIETARLSELHQYSDSLLGIVFFIGLNSETGLYCRSPYTQNNLSLFLLVYNVVIFGCHSHFHINYYLIPQTPYQRLFSASILAFLYQSHCGA